MSSFSFLAETHRLIQLLYVGKITHDVGEKFHGSNILTPRKHESTSSHKDAQSLSVTFSLKHFQTSLSRPPAQRAAIGKNYDHNI